MSEAVFQPAAPPGFAVDSAIQGFESGQSMMMRASQIRQQRQMEQLREQQINENRALLPVKIAAAGADIASAAASIATNTRMQDYRKQAAEASPTANAEFLDALKLASWDAQSAELSRIQAKYSFMGQLPEYKGFLDTVDKARANAVTRGLTDQKLEQMEEASKEAAQSRVAAAAAGAASRETVAGINAGARKDAAETSAGARVGAATIAAGARQDAAADSHEAAAARTEYRGNMQAALEADKEAIKFEEAGNEDAADQARKRAMSFRRMAKKNMAPAPAPEGPKLYSPPAEPGQAPSFTSEVKTPDDVLSAMQQMVNDGVISADQARATLKKLGFKNKGK